MLKILSGDNANVELDGYRAPDGDAVLLVGGKSFRFTIGSQPFNQTDIYVQGAKLVDAIIRYQNNKPLP